MKEKFLNLFYIGHNPASALKSYKSYLMIEKGKDYYQAAADGKWMPTPDFVRKLFEKEFTKSYGSISSSKGHESLENLLSKYKDENEGAIATFSPTKDGQHYYVVLCTPMMLRIHEKISQSSEVVLVDAAGGMDKDMHFLVTPCVVGGLPLGVLVTDTEQTEVFFEALDCFKKLLPPTSFYGKQEPCVFITDNDLKEISGLEKVFPNAIKLLCQFHNLKAFWAWLCDTNHDVSKEHRQEIYFLFRKMQYAATEKTAREFLCNLVDFAVKEKYSKLIIHLSDLMKIKEKWMLLYRNDLPLRGSNTTNYVEVAFKILKDCVLERIMAFNLTQLVDYILARFSSYLYQRLVDVVNGRHTSSIYRHEVMLKNIQKDALSKLHVLDSKMAHLLCQRKVKIPFVLLTLNVGSVTAV